MVLVDLLSVNFRWWYARSNYTVRRFGRCVVGCVVLDDIIPPSEVGQVPSAASPSRFGVGSDERMIPLATSLDTFAFLSIPT